MGDDLELTKDEKYRFWFNYSPVEEFLKQTARKAQSHLLWFIFGILLVQPILLASASQPLSELFIIGWHPQLGPLAVTTVGCSLLLYKFLLIQEHALHSQPAFNTPDWISRQRIALLFLSVVFALTILGPLFYTINIVEGDPTSPFDGNFMRISALSALLSYKYISKLLWDVLEPSKHGFRILGLKLLALAAIMIGILNLPIFSSVDFSLRQNAEMLLTSGLIIGSLYVGIGRQLNQFRASYPDDVGNPQSRPLATLRESRLVSIGAGSIVGVGLPLAASVQTARDVGVNYGEMLVVEHLIVGYMSAIIGIVALIWVYLVSTIAIAVIFGISIALEQITTGLYTHLRKFK